MSGNQLQLVRGSVALTMTDDNVTQNIGVNTPLIYGNSISVITSQDQMLTQRLSDPRYIRRGGANIAENIAMSGFKLTGLANATAAGEAIEYSQLLSLMRGLGFRRSNAMSIYAGDLPLGNNFTMPAGSIVADSQLTFVSSTHFVSGASANYFRTYVNHGYGHDKVRVFVQPYSTRSDTSKYTYDNDNGMPVWICN